MKTLIQLRPATINGRLKWEAYKFEKVKFLFFTVSRYKKIHYFFGYNEITKEGEERIAVPTEIKSPFNSYGDFESLKDAKKYISDMYGTSVEYLKWRP